VGVESGAVIETTGLRKEFRTRPGRRVVAVDGLDLTVPAGGVHGLLGPTGSGKTTTIRMLLGLARPSRGQVRLFGRPVPRRLPEVMPRIGAVVDRPGFEPGLSARTNLALLARSVGVPRSAVEPALAQVGLEPRDRRSVRRCSRAARQRLALAAALLRSPELLVLDEPTAGLAPAAAREIRTLVRAVGDSGVTVLLGSRSLAEVQQLCHLVSLIGDGRLLASGPVDDLVGAGSVRAFTVGVADPAAAADVLARARFRVRREGHRLTVEGAPTAANLGEDISRVLAEREIFVHDLQPVPADLESVLRRLGGAA